MDCEQRERKNKPAINKSTIAKHSKAVAIPAITPDDNPVASGLFVSAPALSAVVAPILFATVIVPVVSTTEDSKSIIIKELSIASLKGKYSE